MRVAIISDVHANLEALEEVLARVRGAEVYCLGDFVDYGAEPNEVIQTLKEGKAKAVLGNHDRAALTGDTTGFNARAAISSKWTAERLSAESKAYLRDLPLELRAEVGDARFYATHGSPDDPLWEYVDPSTHHLLFGHYLGKCHAAVIGLGHTHVPYVWKEERGTVFNPGSVGQPRDGDKRASFAWVTVGEGGVEVEVERVEYDHEKAASKIRAAGLPEFFAERLYSGT
jgi:putative phosphoesterase